MRMSSWSRWLPLVLAIGCSSPSAGTPDPAPPCKPRAATYLVHWGRGIGSCGELPEKRIDLHFPVQADDGCKDTTPGATKTKGTCAVTLSEETDTGAVPPPSSQSLCYADSFGAGSKATISGEVTFDTDGNNGKGKLTFKLRNGADTPTCDGVYDVTYTKVPS